MKLLHYILVIIGAFILYFTCMGLGSELFSNVNDWISLFHGFYFSALILVCTAVIVDEIRKKKA